MATDKFFLRPTQLLEHVEDSTKTATATTAIAAKGASSVTVAAITGVVNGATILIGAGETAEINIVNGAPSGSNIALTFPLGKNHPIGARVIPMVTYDFGDPTEDGFKINIDAGSQDINLATKRVAIAILRDYITASADWTLPVFDMPQLATTLGMKQSRVTGSGTAPAPAQFNVDGTAVGEDINRGVTIIGKLVDGTDYFVEFHGCTKDYTQAKITLRTGQLAGLANRAVANSQIVVGTSIPTYTVDVSKKGAKGRIFNLPKEFGIYTPATATPLNTTLSAAAAAGATALTVADSTNGVASDRVLIGSGDQGEIGIIDSAPDATHLAMRTQLNAAHASAETVVEQQQVPWGSVTDDGLNLTIGGSTKELGSATTRIKGSAPATATLSLDFMVGDLSPANFAYATGAPQADVSGGRLVLGDNIGTSDVALAYFRGVNLAGNTIEVNVFGCSQEVKGIAAQLSAKDVAKLPITLRPTMIQFLRY